MAGGREVNQLVGSMNDDSERRFWLEKRHALIIELDAIEERWLPDKRAETLAAREWLRNRRKEKVESAR